MCLQSKIAWGAECQEFAVILKGETGQIGTAPAIRAAVDWVKIPAIVITYAKKYVCCDAERLKD